MITLRSSNERHCEHTRKREIWRTFHASERAHSGTDHFGTLEILDEYRLPPGVSVPRSPQRAAEIVSYVHEGALAYEDSLGRSGIIHAGEFQRMSAGRGVRHSEKNTSRTDWAHVFKIGLCSVQAGLESGHEQKRFSSAERRGGLCLVASPDARRGSLRLYQNAWMYSALLDPGQHVVHELSHRRSAWLHLVQGEVSMGDDILTSGDGAGVTAELAVSLTAREGTELLLLDVGEPQAKSAVNGGAQ